MQRERGLAGAQVPGPVTDSLRPHCRPRCADEKADRGLERQPRSQTSKTQGFQTWWQDPTLCPSQPPPLSLEEASETPPSCSSHSLLRTPVRRGHTLCFQLPLLRTEQERRDVACSGRGQPGRGKTSGSHGQHERRWPIYSSGKHFLLSER